MNNEPIHLNGKQVTQVLALSVGNTRTAIGAFVSGQLIESRSLDNGDRGLIGEVLHAHGTLHPQRAAVVLASVNAAVAAPLISVIAARLGTRVHRIESDVPVPIVRQLAESAAAGEDRLLNAAAAYALLQRSCVIVDAGTAMTIDYVDDRGTFHGGAIGAGAQLMLDALHARASQLPPVVLAPPSAPLGRDTVDAMRAAVFYGLRGMVSALADEYAWLMGGTPLVVATGGDAELLFHGHPRVYRIIPELTLWGIALSWQASSENLGG